MRKFQPQQPYKTISSQDDTRHGTSIKKGKSKQKNRYPSQSYNNRQQQIERDRYNIDNYQIKDNSNLRREYEEQDRVQQGIALNKINRNYHLHSLNDQINKLKNTKAWQIQKERYKSASLTNKQIKKVLGKTKVQFLRNMSLDHLKQKQQIKQRHQLQMMKFKRWWTGYFQFLKQRQRAQLAKWQRQQQDQYQYLRNSLTKKYQTMRSHSRQLLDLQKQKKGLIKLQRYQDLHAIKIQKKKLKKKLQSQKNKEFMQIVQAQDQKFKKLQTKRYTSLMMRMQDQKRDAKRKFNRDQLRLKQKYKNVVSQLNHQQTIQINVFLGKAF